MRKVRSDCTVGTFEKTRGLPPGTIRNPNGRDTRSDKLIKTIRKEHEKEKNKRNINFRAGLMPARVVRGKIFNGLLLL